MSGSRCVVECLPHQGAPASSSAAEDAKGKEAEGRLELLASPKECSPSEARAKQERRSQRVSSSRVAVCQPVTGWSGHQTQLVLNRPQVYTTLLGGTVYLGGVGAVKEATSLNSMGIHAKGSGLIVNCMGSHYLPGEVPVPCALRC